MTEQPAHAGRPSSAKGRALPVAASAQPSGSVPANQVVEQVLGRTGAGEALPERLKVRERLVDVEDDRFGCDHADQLLFEVRLESLHTAVNRWADHAGEAVRGDLHAVHIGDSPNANGS